MHKWCCAPKGAAFLWVRRIQRRKAALEQVAQERTALGTKAPSPNALVGSLAVALFPEHTPRVPTPDALYNALVARGIEVPIVPLPGYPSGFVRIAAQVYNSEAEFTVLASALRDELGLG